MCFPVHSAKMQNTNSREKNETGGRHRICICFIIILCIIIMFDSVLFRYIFKYEFKGSSRLTRILEQEIGRPISEQV